MTWWSERRRVIQRSYSAIELREGGTQKHMIDSWRRWYEKAYIISVRAVYDIYRLSTKSSPGGKDENSIITTVSVSVQSFLRDAARRLCSASLPSPYCFIMSLSWMRQSATILARQHKYLQRLCDGKRSPKTK